ncbi:MAG: arylsulfatase [Acidobacteria bacterium]|nr:arylsulfatase [Acidobacteriota bacterium]
MTRRAFLASASAAAAVRKPNVLLILADDLGFSDLGCFGGEIATPNLDALAANGVRMTQFYNYTRCCPSRAALMTGQYPHQVGVGAMIGGANAPARPEFPGYQPRMRSGVETMPMVMKRAGYKALMCGKWHLGAVPSPIERGFDEFYGMVHGFDSFWNEKVYTRLPAGRPVREYKTFYATDAITDHALDFLKQARSEAKPWFLYLAYNAPHFPLHAPKAEIDKYQPVYEKGWDKIRAERMERLKARKLIDPAWTETPRSTVPPNRFYPDGGTNPAWDSLDADRRKDLARRMAIFAAMVDRMDRNIGRVIADLKATGEIENTLILFFSDNGACAEWDFRGFDDSSGPNNRLHKGADLDKMGQAGTYHSYGSGWANAGNTPFRLYKHYGHEGGISTAFIAHWPGALKPAVVHRPALILDVLPALEAIANGRPDTPLIATWKGRSVNRGPLYWEHEGNRAMREGRWKIAANGPAGEWELYDIERDRTEMHDLAGREPARVKAMARKWDEWARGHQVLPWPWKT